MADFLENYPPHVSLRKNCPIEKDLPPKKVLFLGDERVGKTTFIRRYCEHMRRFYRCDTYSGRFLVFTQFLFYKEYFGQMIPIRFLDLPRGVSEESRRDQYPNIVNLVVLCFAVDNPTSLDHVWQRWLPEFREHLSRHTRFYLLGLKCDMRLEMEAAGRTPITTERARQIHERYEFSGDYLECSVEGNPEYARRCMETFINDVYMHNSPSSRAADQPQ